jgi:DMSO/TMAO reductase YedYZ molybdopterin-dependent catalytic subunit
MKTSRSRRLPALLFGLGAILLIATIAGTILSNAQETTVDQIEAGEYLMTADSAQPIQVEGVEVREYEGERLGSITDFRENSIKGVQYVDEATYALAIGGLVGQPASWSYDRLLEMEHLAKLVTIHCVEGWSVKTLWEGIPLQALLEQVQPHAEANTVIFHAADGYTTSLPLELIFGRNLIIADRINGIRLPPANGFPFQLVAEDKWGYKWIKWIVRIELSNDPSYQGFWESRGFSSTGDADGSKYGE